MAIFVEYGSGVALINCFLPSLGGRNALNHLFITETHTKNNQKKETETQLIS